jgi:phosphatidate cytidylyltransferase
VKTRVTTGVVLTALALTVLYLRGVVLLIAGTLLLLAAQYEVMHAFEQGGIKPYRALVYIVGALLGTVVFFAGARAGLLFLLGGLFVQSLSILLFRDFVFDRLLMTLFSMAYPALNFLAMFAMLLGTKASFACGFCAIFAAVGCDTFAWLFGRKFGRHKLCPAISPHKTVEGALGGVLGAVLAMIVVKYLLGAFSMPISWILVFLAGIIGSIASEAGDLFASGLKRYCKIKDYSSLLPGHGGIMDRLDGILFSSAALYFVGFLINMF